MRRLLTILLCAALVLGATLAVQAEVKATHKTLVKFEGMLGKVIGLFGGKAAREGVTSTVAIQGNRSMTTHDTTGELVDLDAEKVYEIDFKNKSYKVKTFAEMRKEWEETKARMQKQSEKERKGDEPEFEIDFDVKKTGQQKTVNGYACDQVVTTIAMRQKGKTLDEGGGMVITADSWMAPRIAALDEETAFQLRYMKAVYGADAAGAARDMMQALAMYPQLKAGMAKMQAEAGKLQGTPIVTVTTIESVDTPEQAKARAEREQGGEGGGMGGLAGGLGGLLRRKKADQPAENAAPSGNKNRSTILTSTTELLGVQTSVAAADVALPVGFKQK